MSAPTLPELVRCEAGLFDPAGCVSDELGLRCEEPPGGGWPALLTQACRAGAG